MTLTADIIFQKKVIATKGTKVELIADHGSVLIVEANGLKFSVLKTDVK